MEHRRADTTSAAKNQAIPPPTATVKVSDKDELDVWVEGQGTPVVLVHGALVGSLLKPLAESLAEKGHYKAIWYQRRGYGGKSTEPPVEVGDHARDLVKILDALDIDRAHVVGHSAGGAYVLELAMQAQERLLSAFLLDMVLIGQVESGKLLMQAWMSSVEKAQGGDFEGAGEEFLSVVGGSEDVVEGAVPGSWSIMKKDAPTWFAIDIPAAGRWIPEPENVSAIEIPIAYAPVSKHPAFRETGELLQKWQPNVEVLDFPDAGHFFPVTETAETAAFLDDWIQSLSDKN